MALPPSRRRWKRRRELQSDGRPVVVHELLPYRAWKDDDVDHGAFACSVQHGPFENILGHARTLTGAKKLADIAEAEDGE